MAYALTNIQYDDSFIAVGSEVNEADFPEEILDLLKEAGAVGEAPLLSTPTEVADFIAAKDAEIAALKAQLDGQGAPADDDEDA